MIKGISEIKPGGLSELLKIETEFKERNWKFSKYNRLKNKK